GSRDGAPVSWCGSGLFRCFLNRVYRYIGSAVGFTRKRDRTCLRGKQGMVAAHADVHAWVPGRAALTRNDVARNDDLAAELLDTKALRLGIATVTRGTASFFVCHGSSPSVPEFLSRRQLQLQLPDRPWRAVPCRPAIPWPV